MEELHDATSIPAFVVAGVHSGVGKTSLAVGLMVAMRERGLRVQPFKVGPDFLDPMHHTAACGVPSVNLDGWMLGHSGCKAAFSSACARSKADIAIIEGVMGLHDGLDGKSEKGSTAEIAKWLGAPVVLVIDAWCLSRSAAAMVLGYSAFDPEVPMAGVVFNRVAGEAHATWLREAMQSSPLVAHIPVLGCLPKDTQVELGERHLGLKMPSESPPRLEALGRLVSANMELDRICPSATSVRCEVSTHLISSDVCKISGLPPVRIGVARDEAFCFYYEDNLTLLEAAGATLVPFSPLQDAELPPDLQALYFGGGYPETHGRQLQSNITFRNSVHAFCAAGGFCWAECGGLMYLAQTMGVLPAADPSVDASNRFDMVGLLPFDVDMTKRMIMGYCTARPSPELAALLQLPPELELRCQQFHFSEITLNGEPAVAVDNRGRCLGLNIGESAAYDVRLEQPGAGFAPEGIVYGATVASYCHVHFGCSPGFAEKFVLAARRHLSVASLLPSGTEAVYAIPCLRERLIAVSSHCDYPPEVLSLRRATSSLIQVEGRTSDEVEAQVQHLISEGITDFHPIDVEWLRAARPGLMLAQDSCPTCDAETSSIGKAVAAAGLEHQRVVGIGATTIEDVLDMLSKIGAALGEPKLAALVKTRLQSRLDRISQLVLNASRPRVLGLESICPLVASGQWLPDMRLRAGAEDALGDAPGAAPRRLSWEEVVASDADVIIVSCCGRSASEAANDVEKYFLSQPGCLQLPAMQVRPPKIFAVGHALFSRPGPRVVDGVEQVAALVHPNFFPKAAARDALQLHIDDSQGKMNFAWHPVSECTSLENGCGGLPHASWWTLRGLGALPKGTAHSLISRGSASNDFLLVAGEAPSEGCSSDVWSIRVVDNTAIGSKMVCSSVSGELVPTARSNHAATVWNDMLLVFGGLSTDGRLLAELELLHLKTFCWTHGSTTGSIPRPRGNHTVVVDKLGSRAIVFGGWDGVERFADVHVLDLHVWHWQVLDCGPGPCARTEHVACAWDAEGMVIHGGSSASGKLGDTWILRWHGLPTEWRWEQLSFNDDRVPARSLHAALVVDDSLLITGGQGPDSNLLADTWIFRLRERCWEPGPPLPRPVCRHGSVLLHSGIMTWGGHDGTSFTGEPWFLFRSAARSIASQASRHSTKCRDAQTTMPPKQKIVWDSSKPLSADCVKARAESGNSAAAHALAAIGRLKPEKRTQATWAMLHRMATQQGRDQYVDPATGYSVFTATFLKKRPCCGFRCRHCPHGHANVPKKSTVDLNDW